MTDAYPYIPGAFAGSGSGGGGNANVGALLQQHNNAILGLFISSSEADESWHMRGVERQLAEPAVPATFEFTNQDRDATLTFSAPLDWIAEPETVNGRSVIYDRFPVPREAVSATYDVGTVEITSTQVGALGDQDLATVVAGTGAVSKLNAQASVEGDRGPGTAETLLHVRSPDFGGQGATGTITSGSDTLNFAFHTDSITGEYAGDGAVINITYSSSITANTASSGFVTVSNRVTGLNIQVNGTVPLSEIITEVEGTFNSKQVFVLTTTTPTNTITLSSASDNLSTTLSGGIPAGGAESASGQIVVREAPGSDPAIAATATLEVIRVVSSMVYPELTLNIAASGDTAVNITLTGDEEAGAGRGMSGAEVRVSYSDPDPDPKEIEVLHVGRVGTVPPQIDIFIGGTYTAQEIVTALNAVTSPLHEGFTASLGGTTGTTEVTWSQSSDDLSAQTFLAGSNPKTKGDGITVTHPTAGTDGNSATVRVTKGTPARALNGVASIVSVEGFGPMNFRSPGKRATAELEAQGPGIGIDVSWWRDGIEGNDFIIRLGYSSGTTSGEADASILYDPEGEIYGIGVACNGTTDLSVIATALESITVNSQQLINATARGTGADNRISILSGSLVDETLSGGADGASTNTGEVRVVTGALHTTSTGATVDVNIAGDGDTPVVLRITLIGDSIGADGNDISVRVSYDSSLSDTDIFARVSRDNSRIDITIKGTAPIATLLTELNRSAGILHSNGDTSDITATATIVQNADTVINVTWGSTDVTRDMQFSGGVDGANKGTATINVAPSGDTAVNIRVTAITAGTAINGVNIDVGGLGGVGSSNEIRIGWDAEGPEIFINVRGTYTLTELVAAINAASQSSVPSANRFTASIPPGGDGSVSISWATSDSAAGGNNAFSGGTASTREPLSTVWDATNNRLTITARSGDTFGNIRDKVTALDEFQAATMDDNNDPGDVWFSLGVGANNRVVVPATVGDSADYDFTGGSDTGIPRSPLAADWTSPLLSITGAIPTDTAQDVISVINALSGGPTATLHSAGHNFDTIFLPAPGTNAVNYNFTGGAAGGGHTAEATYNASTNELTLTVLTSDTFDAVMDAVAGLSQFQRSRGGSAVDGSMAGDIWLGSTASTIDTIRIPGDTGFSGPFSFSGGRNAASRSTLTVEDSVDTAAVAASDTGFSNVDMEYYKTGPEGNGFTIRHQIQYLPDLASARASATATLGGVSVRFRWHNTETFGNGVVTSVERISGTAVNVRWNEATKVFTLRLPDATYTLRQIQNILARSASLIQGSSVTAPVTMEVDTDDLGTEVIVSSSFTTVTTAAFAGAGASGAIFEAVYLSATEMLVTHSTNFATSPVSFPNRDAYSAAINAARWQGLQLVTASGGDSTAGPVVNWPDDVESGYTRAVGDNVVLSGGAAGSNLITVSGLLQTDTATDLSNAYSGSLFTISTGNTAVGVFTAESRASFDGGSDARGRQSPTVTLADDGTITIGAILNSNNPENTTMQELTEAFWAATYTNTDGETLVLPFANVVLDLSGGGVAGDPVRFQNRPRQSTDGENFIPAGPIEALVKPEDGRGPNIEVRYHDEHDTLQEIADALIAQGEVNVVDVYGTDLTVLPEEPTFVHSMYQGGGTFTGTGLDQTTADARYLRLAGGTMTGKVTLDGAPTDDLHAASKKYVDDNSGGSTTQVQSDWDVTDDTSLAYIENKPTIGEFLPTLPDAGSRDNKIPKFDGDTLGWEDDATGGSSPTNLKGLPIPVWSTSTSYKVNELVVDAHGRVFRVRNAIASSSSSPAQSSDYEAVDSYEGDYADNVAYPKGALVVHSGNIYFVQSTVLADNTSPPGTNSAFVQINGGGGTSGITETQADTRYLRLAGGTMTGKITLDGAPTNDLHASTKKYVDDNTGISETAADAKYLALAGGTMTGKVTLDGDPSANLHAATKQYVDNLPPQADSLVGGLPQGITGTASATGVSDALLPNATTDIEVTEVAGSSLCTQGVDPNDDKIAINVPGTYRLYGTIAAEAASATSSVRTAPGFTVDGTGVEELGYMGEYLRGSDSEVSVRRWVDFKVTSAGAIVTLQVINRNIIDGSGAVVIGGLEINSVSNLELSAISGVKGADGTPGDLSLGTRTGTTLPIENSGGGGVTLPAATTSAAGVLTASGQSILDGLPPIWNGTSDSYSSGDLVTWDGKFYEATSDVTAASANNNPATDTSNWETLAADADLSSLVYNWALQANPSAFVPDSKIPDGIARDSEVTADITAAVAGLLNQTEVDARVVAGVLAWARTGSTDDVPDGKIPNTITRNTQLAQFRTEAQINSLITTALTNYAEWEQDWVLATSYSPGAIVRHTHGTQYATYLCHTTTAGGVANSEPGVGSAWETTWYRLGYSQGDPNSFTGASLVGEDLTLTRASGQNSVTVDLSELTSGGGVSSTTRAESIFFNAIALHAGTSVDATPRTTNPISVVTPVDSEAEILSGISSNDFTVKAGLYLFVVKGTNDGTGEQAAQFHIRDASDDSIIYSSTNEYVFADAVDIEAVGILFLEEDTLVNVTHQAIRRTTGMEADWSLTLLRWGSDSGSFGTETVGIAQFGLAGTEEREVVELQDSGGNAIVCPEENVYLIARSYVPSLGLRGAVEWIWSPDLRVARSATAISDNLPAALVTNGLREIIFITSDEGVSSASTGNSIVIEKVVAHTAAIPSIKPSISEFRVTGDQNPTAGDISGDTYNFVAGISQSGHSAGWRIIGYPGTADSRPSTVTTLYPSGSALETGDKAGTSGTVTIPANTMLAADAKYTIELQVFATGETATDTPSTYHDYVITAQAAQERVKFGLVLSSASSDYASDGFTFADITTSSQAAGMYNTGTIAADTGPWNLYWAVPSDLDQPTVWTHNGINVSSIIVMPAPEYTESGVTYKIYRTESVFDDLGSNQVYTLS